MSPVAMRSRPAQAAAPAPTARHAAALRSRISDVPLPFWVLGAACSLAALLTSSRAPTADLGDAGLLWLVSQVFAVSQPLPRLAVVIAPLVAPAAPGVGFVMALLGLMPLEVWSAHAAYQQDWPMQAAGLVSMLGVLLAGAWRAPRRTWVVGLCSLVIPFTSLFCGPGLIVHSRVVHTSDWTPRARVTAFVVCVLASVLVAVLGWLLARSATASRQRSADLLAAEGAVRTQQAQVHNEAVAVGERARLARDLHDIVAHRISLIAVRAETAPFMLSTLDAGTREVFEDIANDARTALEEMRGVLGVLNRSADRPELAPQPGVGDIPDLIEETRAAGTPVVCTGELPPLPDTVGVVAYRVLQEALTNARRHGDGVVSVVFGATEHEVSISVSNPATTGPTDPGRGLTGMHERLGMIGGQVVTQWRDNVFTVLATMPRDPEGMSAPR